MKNEQKNLPEPDDRDVRTLHDGEAVERRHRGDVTPPDHRVEVYSLKLPSIGTALSWLDRISVLAHEANRIWALLHGDTSAVSYVDAPQWQKESLHAGVASIANGTITTPEEAHEAWADHKLKAGWVHGFVKNPDTKEHPCLVPYDQLPPEQRAKDAIFFGLVTTLVQQEVA